MRVGEFVENTRTFNAEDLREYHDLCGHMANDRAVPEPLIGALFSYLLGVKLPGVGTMYLKQETRFMEDALVEEQLTARVEITRLRPDKQLADLSTTCIGQDGRLVASGRALVYIGDVDHHE